MSAESTAVEVIDDDREIEVTGPGKDLAVIGAISRAELDQQITTARAYPRSIKRFINECRDMALLNEAIAAEMFYILPRGGKKIEGPSVRMAEIVQSAWGNCQSGARVVDEGKEFVTAQGIFYDLERNVKVTMEVRRRITDKDGNRYNQDMIGVTSAAASSIALRNAIFRGIPKGFWNGVYEEARKVARGNLKSLVTNRSEALDWLSRRGVPNDMVIKALGLNGIEDIGLDELETLRGMVNAIKDGEQIETVFAAKEVRAPQSKIKPPTSEPKRKGKSAAKPDPKETAGTSASPATGPSSASARTENRQQTAPAASGSDSTDSTSDDEPVISVDQATRINDAIHEEGIKTTLFLATFEIGGVRELPAAQYEKALAWILAGGE